MKCMEKVRLILDQKQLKPADLARLTGYKPSRISLWFSGTGVPDIYQAARIAEKLDVPLLWLASESDDGPESFKPLNEDEEYVIKVYRDLELTSKEAVRRMSDDQSGFRARPRQEAGGRDMKTK